MKKLFYTTLLFFGLFLSLGQIFAQSSDFLELKSFKTIDKKEYFSKNGQDDFKPYSEFQKESSALTSDSIRKPSIVTLNGKSICVAYGLEQETMDKCEGTLNSAISNTGSSSCIVNGKEVDCAEMAHDIKTGFASILKYGAVLGLLGLLSTIFYIWMLVHAISKPIPNKVVWTLVIFFLSPIGAIVYYFAIKRKFIEGSNTTNTSPQTVPYAVNVGVTYNEGPVVADIPVQTEGTTIPSSQINPTENNPTQPTP